MQIFYNGTDITDQTTVTQCENDSYLDGHTDTLFLEFDNVQQWTGWGAAPGDTVLIREELFSSGKMYVNQVRAEKGRFSVMASALKKQGQEQYTEWRNISFQTLIKTIAARMDMTVTFYGAENPIYQSVIQSGENDLSFLSHRARLEGCTTAVFNDKIQIIAHDFMESTDSSSYQLSGNTESTRLFDLPYFGGCTVSCRENEITGAYTENPELAIRHFILGGIELESIEQARRFAKNMLAYENSSRKTGVIYSDAPLPEITAGSKVTVDTDYWKNKIVIVTHVRHNFTEKKTKIWFRLARE